MRLKAKSDRRSEALFRRLKEVVRKKFRINEDGSLVAEALLHGEVRALITLCLKSQGQVPAHLMQPAITAGLRKILEEDADLTKFVEEANANLRKKVALKKIRYVMCGDLNICWRSGYPALKIGIEDLSVYFGPSLPTEFQNVPHESIEDSSIFSRNVSRSFIWVYGSGPDSLSVGERMDRALNIAQGLFNIQCHLKNQINIFPSDFRPISIFDHGPNYFIFDRDAKEWCPHYWISDQNFEKIWRDKSRSVDEISKILGVVRKHRDRLLTSPFKERLVECLLNLNASWKAVTKSRRAIYQWMALESLYSNRGEHSDQATIIRRATHGLSNNLRQIAADRLRLVAEIRNSEVHSYTNFDDGDPAHIVMQKVNLYIVNCYLELLNIDRKFFKTDDDFIKLTELGGDIDELRRKRRVLDYAIGLAEN